MYVLFSEVGRNLKCFSTDTVFQEDYEKLKNEQLNNGAKR